MSIFTLYKVLVDKPYSGEERSKPVLVYDRTVRLVALKITTITTDYMSNIVSLVSDDPGRRRLRSATTDYHVPRTRTKLGLGDRAFSIAGPKAWNNLPQSVRSADSLDSFKRKLKFLSF